MKIDLTITDMNPEEFAQIFTKINGVEPVVSKTDITEVNMPKTDITEPVEPDAVDKDGLHWDARIHSSNHQMTAKGVWQRRRGISDAEFDSVKNELLGVQAPVAPVAPAPVAEPVVAPVIAPAPLAAPEPVVAPAPVAEPAPAPVADSAVLYNTMFEKLRIGMTNGKIAANDIQNLVIALNSQMGTQYQSLAIIKDDIPALQFVINNLVARGL